MNEEKYYIVNERQLINLLISDMICQMNKCDGIDNFSDYGSSYDDIIKEYWPDGNFPTVDENGKEIYIDMEDCAKARLEAGEFQEFKETEELDAQEMFNHYYNALNVPTTINLSDIDF